MGHAVTGCRLADVRKINGRQTHASSQPRKGLLGQTLENIFAASNRRKKEGLPSRRYERCRRRSLEPNRGEAAAHTCRKKRERFQSTAGASPSPTGIADPLQTETCGRVHHWLSRHDANQTLLLQSSWTRFEPPFAGLASWSIQPCSACTTDPCCLLSTAEQLQPTTLTRFALPEHTARAQHGSQRVSTPCQRRPESFCWLLEVNGPPMARAVTCSSLMNVDSTLSVSMLLLLLATSCLHFTLPFNCH